MKKIAAVITFLLAFTFSANAQEAKLSIQEAAEKDTMELAEFLGLAPEEQVHLVALFKQKHKIMRDPTIPAARKEETSKNIALKINASIKSSQQEKLAANPELLERLTK